MAMLKSAEATGRCMRPLRVQKIFQRWGGHSSSRFMRPKDVGEGLPMYLQFWVTVLGGGSQNGTPEDIGASL